MGHGVYTYESATSVVTPNKATSGIPFVIGIAPLSSVDADKRAEVNVPVLATSFAEAEEKLGFSDNFTDYGISEFMYYHFKLAGCQPAIFLPLTETISTQAFNGDGTAKTFTVTDKPDCVHNVKVSGVEVEVVSYVKSTGVVTLKTAPAVGTDNVVVTYLSKPTAATVAAAVEYIDLCMPMFSVIPDLIAAPGYSHESLVAATMATKISAVNGLFKGKAAVDIDAESYTAAITAKNGGSFNSDQILCWPNGTLGEYVFHGSTVEIGRIAQIDTKNEGVPFESPSNKGVSLDGLITPGGTRVVLTWAQANILNDAGICTFLNFMSGWTAWGNVTGCFPSNRDVKDYFIPVNRMFDWVANTLIKTFWSKLDDPTNPRLVDTILNSCNIWLNGLAGRGWLYGGRVEMLDSENPLTDLMAGIIHLHLFFAPPPPAQEIDFTLEYDISYVQTAFAA